MTQQQLADKVSVSSRTIISLEKGKYNPSVLLAYKIAKIFNISIEELFTFEEEESGL
ncbi:putative transcriptional regulator [Salimicrobium jeotgali]|nr:putative transcriptional regulator [Salimicrobium jeotgali]